MPLILFAASPGTITGIITLSVAHTRFGLPITALVAVVVASGVQVQKREQSLPPTS
jgi:multiple antibiotic resistance protein